MKNTFNKKRYKKKIQKPSRKESIHYFFVEAKKIPKIEESLKEFYELFDSELISFYDFIPEKETFSEACEKIDKGEKRKLN